MTAEARLSFGAIAYGTMLAIGLFLLYAMLLGALSWALGLTWMQAGWPAMLVALTLGLGFTALGGFVAAKRAGRRAIAHGAGVGVVVIFVSTLVALLPMAMGAAPPVLWQTIVSDVLTLLAAVFGAWVLARGNRPGERMG